MAAIIARITWSCYGTAVMDCALYRRGRHFVIKCDHQALAPIFQKKLKGQIYERWLAILQQFDLLCNKYKL